MEKINKGVGLLDNLLNLQHKYGFFSILKSLLLIFLLGYVIFFALNPSYLIERIDRIQTENHKEGVSQRLKSDNEIRLLLEQLLNRTASDRTWLIEFHNGNSNLGSGLPFLFGSMRLEAQSDSIPSIEEEYSDFNLSKYPLINKVISDGYYYGDTEAVKKFDNKLYYKLKSNDVNEIAMIALFGGDKLLGVLGISFCNKKMNPKQTGKEIRKIGVLIANSLTP